MISQDMVKLGTAKSVIRELAAFGAQRAAEVGAENILDFSLGNPSVPAPDAVQKVIAELVSNESPVKYHSYSAGNGHMGCRKAIAENLNKRYGTDYTADNFFMTCGAAASLNITFKALISSSEDEIIVLAPFFPEYTVWITGNGAKQVMVPAQDDMQLNIEGIRAAITPNTKAIVVNSPNNPSGVVYTRAELEKMVAVLNEKSKEYGHPIYIITDEPYRELVLMDDVEVPFVAEMYDNTIVCYSWSKSLSLPGERIGYVLVPNKVEDKMVMPAVAGAARVLGYVCAPTLFQMVIEKCIDVDPDVTVYKKNRDLLYDALTKMGYTVAKPAGAFYLFIKAPDGNSEAFSEKAKKYDMLIVPGTGFGVKEYMRLAFCVTTEKCERSLPVFEKLMAEYK